MVTMHLVTLLSKNCPLIVSLPDGRFTFTSAFQFIDTKKKKYFLTGNEQRDKTRYISIEILAGHLGSDITDTMVGFHAFTDEFYFKIKYHVFVFMLLLLNFQGSSKRQQLNCCYNAILNY
jgi:hypothetical protein